VALDIIYVLLRPARAYRFRRGTGAIGSGRAAHRSLLGYLTSTQACSLAVVEATRQIINLRRHGTVSEQALAAIADKAATKLPAHNLYHQKTLDPAFNVALRPH